MLYNGRHAKSEKVGGWVSSRLGWLLELLTELTKLFAKTTPYNPKPKKIDISNAKTEASPVALVSVESHQLDEQIKSMMTMTENKAYGQKAYACNVCGKEGIGANIKTHIESNHIESNITHSCEICGKMSRSRNGLRLHKAKEHSKQTLLQVQA